MRARGDRRPEHSQEIQRGAAPFQNRTLPICPDGGLNMLIRLMGELTSRVTGTPLSAGDVPLQAALRGALRYTVL